jgi:hypothetical protein
VIHLVILIAALAIGVIAEVVGVYRHKAGKVDTYTEMIHWASERWGHWFTPVVIALVGLLAWSIPHLLDAAGLL